MEAVYNNFLRPILSAAINGFSPEKYSDVTSLCLKPVTETNHNYSSVTVQAGKKCIFYKSLNSSVRWIIIYCIRLTVCLKFSFWLDPGE